MAGLRLLRWREIVSICSVVFLPASLWTQESAGAILHPQGQVTVNDSLIPASWSLSEHDSVRTGSQALAQMDMSGGSVSVGSETMFSYEGNEDELMLDHGILAVNTNRRLKVRVGCIEIWPVRQIWTKYQVTDANGKVHIASQTEDVYVEMTDSRQSEAIKHEHKNRSIVRQGEQATRDERCGAADLPRQSIDAKTPILDTWQMKTVGVAAIGAMTCIALCYRTDDPISPSRP